MKASFNDDLAPNGQEIHEINFVLYQIFDFMPQKKEKNYLFFSIDRSRKKLQLE